MAIDLEQLARLNADYFDQTGIEPDRFVCPITLNDDIQAELINGHILNQGFRQASRATVIQRKDVDGHFGSTIESDLVKLVNIHLFTPQERIRSADPKECSLISPSGQRFPFGFSSKPTGRFQQVDLFTADGRPIGRGKPFIRDGVFPPIAHEAVEVEWSLTLPSAAILGGFLKSAYLALFRMFSYRWVLDPAAARVRRSLALFCEGKAKKDQAINYFAEFRGSILVASADDFQEMPDTLQDGSFLLHYVEGDWYSGLPFALTCLFPINMQLYAVCLPFCQSGGDEGITFSYYQAFLRDRTMPHLTYGAGFHEKSFELYREIELNYGTEPHLDPNRTQGSETNV